MLIRNKSFHFSKKEIKDLIKAWLILSLAFAIVFNGLNFNLAFIITILISTITVGTAFIFHELGHKFTAQHYGCFAEFRSFDNMLFLALILSFFGFIFAAPGAVMISGPIGKRRNGKISLAGPLTNIILAILFLIVHLYSPNIISFYGFVVNTWIGLFNLIPFAMLDGKKIFNWNKVIYGLMVGTGFILLMVQSFISV
jgi:Zn-dependent protease